jgi:hypothetical protein
MPPPLFEWTSSRLTWVTLPIWIWLLAAVVGRLVAAFRQRHMQGGALWRWTFAGAVAWAAIAGLAAYIL